jgi:hypothetical protein
LPNLKRSFFTLLLPSLLCAEEVPSFRRDVMPVFFRAGCNAGACHGSARGKDGFMLSLFGYDTKGDYYRLTQEFIGRRLNLAAPEQSLLVLKATGKVPHTGGELFTKDSAYYRTLPPGSRAARPTMPRPCPSRSALRFRRIASCSRTVRARRKRRSPPVTRMDRRAM